MEKRSGKKGNQNGFSFPVSVWFLRFASISVDSREKEISNFSFTHALTILPFVVATNTKRYEQRLQSDLRSWKEIKVAGLRGDFGQGLGANEAHIKGICNE